MSDLVAGQVRAYRAWRISSGRLVALSRSDVWATPEVTAHCRLHQDTHHLAPGRDCSCGLYAYYRPSTVPPSATQVFGVVSVAGRVILATRGLKAERMTVLALATDDVDLGKRYGVPIYPSREALLSDYPPQDFGELVDVDPSDVPDVVVQIHASVRAFGKSMIEAARSMQEAMTKFTAALHEAAPERCPRPEPTDVMKRALEARRNRHTGPPVGRYRLDGRR